jgi:hypothetical protein
METANIKIYPYSPKANSENLSATNMTFSLPPHPKTIARNTCTTKTQTKTNPKQQTQQTTQPPKRRSAQQPPTTTNKKQTHQNEKLKKERMC